MNEISVAKNQEKVRSCNGCYANNFKESYDAKKVDLLFDVKIGSQVSCLCRDCLNRLIGAAITANSSFQ